MSSMSVTAKLLEQLNQNVEHNDQYNTTLIVTSN